MPTILAIESTCDETGAAVVVDGWDVRSNIVASQIDLHQKYRGVVPEIASRAHIENILPVIQQSLPACGFADRSSSLSQPSAARGFADRSSSLPQPSAARGFADQQSPLATSTPHRSPNQPPLPPQPPAARGFADQPPPLTTSSAHLTPNQTIPTPTPTPPSKPLSPLACDFASVDFSSIDAIAVAHRPGLIGSLLIGVTAAKTLAWSLGKPLIAVDHVHAHLYSVMLETNIEPPMPAIGLVCSGGHTALYHIKSWTDISLIGSTIDDAVGEAYDKVAAILHLGYPGGPILDNLAQHGDPHAIRFPRSMLGRDSLDFSFSGLKTSVLYHVRGVPGRNDSPPPLTDQHIKDIAASFQSACIDTLIKKLHRAAEQFDAKSILIGGGVSANRGLRDAMQKFPLPTFFPKLAYCTDNAAMSAGLAHIFLQQNRLADLILDAITYSQFVEQRS